MKKAGWRARGLGTGVPKTIMVGLHCRIIGRPGWVVELRPFAEYVKVLPGVWVTTRGKIVRRWRLERSYKVGEP